MSAKIRIYTDAATWNNSYKRKENNFTILPIDKIEPSTQELTLSGFIADMTAGFGMMKSYDLDKNPSYYDFTVTKTLKDIVEGAPGTGVKSENKVLLINMGQFVPTTAGSLGGYKFTTRAFATERGVYVGSDKTNANRIQLKITYGTKK